ncbi:helix-turn-helix domain-containing protein [Clostridium tertium]|uniref:Transposase n=1 Tax=Clostridium tertium TaxID=1559 RepID=A0A6N3ALZ6_9CLOT
MGRKTKVSPEIKIKVVKEFLAGRTTISTIAYNLQVDTSMIENWIGKYKNFGSYGLAIKNTNVKYSTDIKLQAVTSYLSGEGSLRELCIKYNISSMSILKGWIKQYNSHKKFKSQNKKGDKIMTNGRKTTYEERIEIVSFCITNANDYNLTANKYKVSFQQVYTWIKKYNKDGYNALVDRRGKNKSFEELTKSEKFSAQLKLLEAENRRLKMKNDFLKKLEEIERR